MPVHSAAFLAGIASHAALDALPHHDYRHLAAHAGDAVVGLALTGVLWQRCRRKRRMAGLAGAVGAVLPDVESVLLLLGRVDEGRMTSIPHRPDTLTDEPACRDTCILYALLLAGAWALVSPDRQAALVSRSVPTANVA